jgi:hypothetical protein
VSFCELDLASSSWRQAAISIFFSRAVCRLAFFLASPLKWKLVKSIQYGTGQDVIEESKEGKHQGIASDNKHSLSLALRAILLEEQSGYPVEL